MRDPYVKPDDRKGSSPIVSGLDQPPNVGVQGSIIGDCHGASDELAFGVGHQRLGRARAVVDGEHVPPVDSHGKNERTNEGYNRQRGRSGDNGANRHTKFRGVRGVRGAVMSSLVLASLTRAGSIHSPSSPMNRDDPPESSTKGHFYRLPHDQVSNPLAAILRGSLD